MRNEFQTEANQLVCLSKDELYQRFHTIQAEVLRSPIIGKLSEIIRELNCNSVQEIEGPKSPEPPANYSDFIKSEIARNNEGLLFLNRSLGFAKDKLETLNSAGYLGYQHILIHDVPSDGTFYYSATPEVQFFSARNRALKEDQKNNSVKSCFDTAKDWATANYWRIAYDKPLNFSYENKKQRLAISMMELSLDLIEFHFAGKVSKFDLLRTELENWATTPRARLCVEGLSRWMLLTKC